MKALVVEDSPTMRSLVVKALSRIKELDCTEAEDGVDGLRKFGDDDFDIVITDINMPMMDGLKLIGMIRKGTRHSDVPIVVITTESAKEDRERGISLGANAYLTKPVDAKEVVNTVKGLLAG